MASVAGSPPFLTMVFEGGVTVAFHSVRALAVKLGLRLDQSNVFELLQDWNVALPALTNLVHALAFEDVAIGHRGNFTEEGMMTVERLLPEARQLFRVSPVGTHALPVTVQASAHSTLVLDAEFQSARPNVCLGAVIGRMCRHTDETEAQEAIAGWVLVTEMVDLNRQGLSQIGYPGSVMIGPNFVPRHLAELDGSHFQMSLTGKKVLSGSFQKIGKQAAASVALLSKNTLLLPGDIVVLGSAAASDAPPLGSEDVLKTVANGLGQQIVSLQHRRYS